MKVIAKFFILVLFVGTVAAGMALKGQSVPQSKGSVKYTADGQLMLPKGFRRWIFIGAPLTPNGLNDGKAGFPEFHNVYVEAWAFDAYQKTGVFPEGTVICKELNLVDKPTHEDGSQDTASGRGFFEGKFNGLDVTVKDSKRFSKTGNWGFFNFGHHAPPYNSSAKPAPIEDCAGCHIAGAGKTDLTWIQFYPVLTDK